MLWIVIASAMSVDTTTSSQNDPRPLFQAGDYPPDAMANRQAGTVIASILVDPNGHVERCTILYSSKVPSLDKATCDVVSKRARFRPALDEGGKALYSVLVTPPITWRLSDAPPPPLVKLNPDAEIGISSAPNGVTLPTDVSVDYVVSAAGQIKSCAASTPGKYSAALVEIACQGSSLPPPLITKNKAGQAVDVLYSSTAHFYAGSP